MMKRILSYIVALSLSIAPVFAQSITPQIGGGISKGFDGGISGGGTSPPVGAADLNFALGSSTGCTTFASCLTNTNSTGGYCTDSSGVLHLIAANALRICSGTGLLAEETRTNQVKMSGDQTAANWGKFNVNVTVSSQLAPDNSSFMSLQTVSASSSNTSVNQLFAPTTVTTYSLSAFFKVGTAPFFVIVMSDAGANWAGVSVNSSTLAVTTNQGGDSSVIGTPIVTSYANGTVRISVSVQSSAASPGNRGFLFQGSSAALSSAFVAGVSGQTTLAWGAQIEAGAFPTSYIASPGASATARSADNTAASGVLATTLAGSTGTVVANTNNSQQSLAGTLVDANGVILLGKTSGNVGTTAVGATLSTANTGTWTGTNDLGLAWNGTGGAIQLNGGTIATDATARTPAATFHVGSTSGSSAFFNGYFARMTAYVTKQASPQ